MFARHPMTVLPFVSDSGPPAGACTEKVPYPPAPSTGCRWTWQITHNEHVANWYHQWLDGTSPITIAIAPDPAG